MSLFSRRKSKILAAVLLLSGSFLLLSDVPKAQAYHATSSYDKLYNDTLTSQNWNDLFSDFVNTWLPVSMNGPLGIAAPAPASGLLVNGPINTTNLFSTGNVGIGTTNPQSNLHIIGSLDATGTVNGTGLCIAGVCKTDWGSVGSTSGWTVNGTTVYKADTNGNVGIGTTAPVHKLEVVGAIATVDNGNNPYIRIGDATNTENGYIQWLSSSNVLTMNTYGGAYSIGLATNGGNVGVGTTNPTYKLEVSGGIYSTSISGLPRKTFFDPMYVNTARYYLIAKLPTSTGGTGEGVMVEVTGKSNEVQGKGKMIVALGQRNGFWYVKHYEGGNPRAYVQAYNQADGSSNVYVYIPSTIPYGSAEVLYYQFGWQNPGAVLYDNPAYSSSVPAGTLIFDSSNEVTYPVNDTLYTGTITTAGNVGIANTNPTQTLDVTGGINASGTVNGIGLCISGDCKVSWPEIVAAGGGGLWSGTTTGAIWNVNSGNVGIGTTNPGQKLDVAGMMRVNSGNNDNYSLAVGNGIVRNGIYIASNDYGLYSEKRIVVADTTNASQFSGAVNLAVTSGNVGIGTTTPTNWLTLYKASGGGYNFFDGLRVVRDGTPTQYSVFNTVGGATRILAVNEGGTHGWTYFDSSNNGSTVRTNMVIDPSGNIGVAKLNPGQTLDVTGGINASGTVNGIGLCISGDCKVSWPEIVAAGGGNLWGGTLNGNIWNGDAGAGNVGIGTKYPGDKFTVSYSDSQTIGWNASGTGFGLKNIANLNGAWSTISFYGSGNIASGIGSQITDQANSYGDIAFYTRNATGWGERLRVASTGNVGIGTTGPGAKLHIQDAWNSAGPDQMIIESTSSGGAGLQFKNSNAAANLWQVFISNDATPAFKIGRGSLADYLTILNGGNVGIGTVNPLTKLDVASAGADNTLTTNLYLSADHGTNRQIALGFGRSDHYDAYQSRIVSNMNSTVTWGSSLQFQTMGGTQGVWNAGMLIDQSGNVGIAKTNPGATLDVVGSINSSGTVNGTGLCISGDCKVSWSDVGAASAGWNVNGTTVYKSNTSGNVGIGTTNPGAKLEVKGDGVVNTPQAIFNMGGGWEGEFRMVTDDAANPNLRMYRNTGGGGFYAYQMVLSGDSVLFQTGAPVATKGTESYSVNTLALKANGNVGVGTTNPGAKLDVSGSTFLNSQNQLFASEGQFNGARFYTSSGNQYARFAGLNDGGYNANSAVITQNSYASYSSGWHWNRDDTAHESVAMRLGLPRWGLWGGASNYFELGYSGSGTGDITWSPGIVMNTSGNVGIAKTNPGANLDVVGSINASGTVNGTGLCIAGVCKTDWGGVGATSGWTVNGTTVYKADTNGNVGIGTTAPNQKLVVGDDVGNITSSPAVTIGDARAGYGGALILAHGSSAFSYISYDAVNGGLSVRPNGVAAAALFVNNNVGVGTVNPIQRLSVSGGGAELSTSLSVNASATTNKYGAANIDAALGRTVSGWGFWTGGGTCSGAMDSTYSFEGQSSTVKVTQGTSQCWVNLPIDLRDQVNTTYSSTFIMRNAAGTAPSTVYFTFDNLYCTPTWEPYGNGWYKGTCTATTNSVASNAWDSFNTGETVWVARAQQEQVATPSSFTAYTRTSPSVNLSAPLQINTYSSAVSYFNGGSVGIGTTNPTARLHVDIGTVNGTVARLLGGGNGGFTFNINNSADALGYGAGYRHGISVGGSESLAFLTNGSATPKLVISAAGNVGIAKVVPGATLDVVGSVNASGTVNGTGLCISGDCKVSWADIVSAGGGNYWSRSGSYVYPTTIGDNVGIGAVNPGAKFDVAQDMSYGSFASQARISGYTNRNQVLELGYDTNSNFGYIEAAVTNSGYRNLALQPSGGNVGIGTTGPVTKLNISESRSDNHSSGVYSGPGDLFVSNTNITGANQGSFIVLGSRWNDGVNNPVSYAAAIKGANDVWANNGAGNLQFYTAAQGAGNQMYERMRIDSYGNVGVGITNPIARLHILGAGSESLFRIENSNASDYGLIKFVENGVGKGYIGMGGSSQAGFNANSAYSADGFSINADGSGVMNISNRGASKTIYLNTGTESTGDFHTVTVSSGNVGIGTVTPGAKLDVNGNLLFLNRKMSFVVNDAHATSDYYKIATFTTGTSYSNDNYEFRIMQRYGEGTLTIILHNYPNEFGSIDQFTLSVPGGANYKNFYLVQSANYTFDLYAYVNAWDSLQMYQVFSNDNWNSPGSYVTYYNNKAASLPAGAVEASYRLHEYGGFTAMGNVGIGKTNPGSNLDVVGSINASGTVNGTGLCISGDCKTSWADIVAAGGANNNAIVSWGQLEPHGTYTDFNTNVTYWGYDYVQGNTNAPNSNSGQWYRSRVSLGSGYGKDFGGSNNYWLETAIPRYSPSTAGGMWIRTHESNAVGAWYQVGSNILGNFTAGGNVGIGNSGPLDNLYITGVNSGGVDVLNNDGNDRPGVTVKGSYPEINLISTTPTNGNHGATLRFVGYHDANMNTWSHWVIGSGGNASNLDFGYSSTSQSNPHMGIANYNKDWGGTDGYTFMRITSGGNIGVGTLSPQGRLNVLAPASIPQMTLGSTNGVGFAVTASDNTGYGQYFGVYGNGNSWIQAGRTDSATAYNLSLQASGGTVGIGLTNPYASLDVNGDLAYKSGRADNLVQDPQFAQDTTWWNRSGNISYVYQNLPDGTRARAARTVTAGVGTTAETYEQSKYIKIDPKKTYRISVWIKGEGGGTGGTKYLGINTYNSSFGETAVYNTGGAGTTNPYFHCGGLPGNDTWYKYTGYIYASDTPNGWTEPSDANGNGCNIGGYTVRFDPNAQYLRIRFYNYSYNVGQQIVLFADPVIEEVNSENPFFAVSNNLSIGNGQNVGIGKTNPGSNLDVVGSINASGTVNGTGLCIAGVCKTDWGATSGWTVNGTTVYKSDTNGSVGIGTTGPAYKLDVNGWIGIGGGNSGAGGVSGYGIALPSTNNDFVGILGENNGADTSNGIFYTTDNVNDGWYFRQSDCCGAGTLDYMRVARDGVYYVGEGNFGIGVTSAAAGAKLEVGGSIKSTGLSISTGDLNMNQNGVTGNITNVNKLTVNTIDPLYKINGVNYATFAASIAGGVKEEYAGKMDIYKKTPAKEYEAILDFSKVAEGSDLWVWRQVVDFNKDNVEVIMTPYGRLAQVYYIIEDNKLIFRADRPVEISYRLTGRRFDWRKWPTKPLDQTENGLFVR